MTSPYADLRARLAPLAAESADEWLTGEQCSDLLSAFLAAYPAIDALLARGEAAEAENPDPAMLLRAAEAVRNLMTSARTQWADWVPQYLEQIALREPS